ncbi:hypothetical protein G9H65_02365 [Cytophagaceae bacterium 50A-KIRBA]|uniref:MBOAT family O-acyltransferase n=2 Tax=Aquirufa ecclesiirivi TaxID=2715124 RepID=UPI00140A8D39|nr:MBOAT family O-acyltransferase [Aquirufa ecclesiirivi]NHC48167.1 hypothetical protein [Aquirufa ecclesiirivi]
MWKALLIGSVLTLGLFMPLTLLVFLLASGITYYLGNKSHSSVPWIGGGVSILLLSLILYKLRESWLVLNDYPYLFVGEQESVWQIMGLSFFVFNAISYLMDIKRGFIQPAESFVKLTTYLLYFPTLFTGPLHRFKYVDSQLNQANVTQKSFSNGMRLILWGVFKNFVIAQRLNYLYVELWKSNSGGLWTLIIGFVFFFYIYFSFSSFVDFFQGVSEIFNVRLKDNFHKRVYLSRNRHEFWRGWHITLNEWFRDYFFYWQMKFKFWRDKPYLLLLLTYLLIGLWHGITVKFFIWGFLNACWILLEKWWKIPERFSRMSYFKFLGILYHLSLCSILALVFISPSLDELIVRISQSNYISTEVLIYQKRNLLIILVMGLVVDQYHRWSKDLRMDMYFELLPSWKRRSIYICICFFIIIFGVFSGHLENYYLRF